MDSAVLERGVEQSLSAARALSMSREEMLATVRETRSGLAVALEAGPEGRAEVAEFVRNGLDWAAPLTDDDAVLLLRELFDVIEQALTTENNALLERFFDEWRETASIHEDPDLLESLQLPRDTDETVERPRAS